MTYEWPVETKMRKEKEKTSLTKLKKMWEDDDKEWQAIIAKFRK